MMACMQEPSPSSRTGKKKGTLAHATQMNSIRVQLLKRLDAEETWGFVTKEHRLLAGLPKTHAYDAAVIATRGETPQFRTTQVILKKCIPDGDYQQTKGVRSEQPITTGKIRGFRKFDKVRYLWPRVLYQRADVYRLCNLDGY